MRAQSLEDLLKKGDRVAVSNITGREASIVYSPPEAVYGDVKEVIAHGKGCVDMIFVITENVSVEVTAKLRRLCDLENFDIIGCNTLGVINAHDAVRVGAVGGDAPAEAFVPGSACIISNSGNMVNTLA